MNGGPQYAIPAAGEGAGDVPLRALDRFVEHGLLPQLARSLGPGTTRRRAERPAESVTAWALLELSNRYRHSLLFRDFGGSWRGEGDQINLTLPGRSERRLSREAMVYVGAVFTRPLQVVSTSPDGLTNSHRLLGALVRHLKRRDGVAWPNTVLARRRGPAPTPDRRAEAFVPLARALDAAVGREIERRGMSGVSMSKLRDQGPVWMRVDSHVARVPEELSFLDVVRIVAGPLESGFDHDGEVRTRVLETIRSANREYAALRALGLFPERYLGRYSIGQLRALAALRSRVRETPCAGEASEAQVTQAFRSAWDSLAEEGAPPPGYDGFESFARSEEGAIVMGRRPEISINEAGSHECVDTATLVDFTEFSSFFASVRSLVACGRLDRLDYLALRTVWEEDRPLGPRAWRARLSEDRQFMEALERDPDFSAITPSRRLGRFLSALERKVGALDLAIPNASPDTTHQE